MALSNGCKKHFWKEKGCVDCEEKSSGRKPHCKICSGSGVMDSGATKPWGEAIYLKCWCQEGLTTRTKD